MAQKKEPTKVVIEEVDIDNFRQQALGTFEKYKNLIYGGLLALIVVVGGLYFYFNMYSGPREKTAQESIFKAEYYFSIDSFQLALSGRELPGQVDASFMGFLDIIAQYGGTAAGKRATYYAGICLVRLGKFDEALKYLEKSGTADPLLQANTYGLIGDCKAELGDMDAAEKFYIKATTTYPNAAMTPVHLRKLGLFYSDVRENNEKALATFESIRKDYPKAAQEMGIDKDIVRVGGK